MAVVKEKERDRKQILNYKRHHEVLREFNHLYWKYSKCRQERSKFDENQCVQKIDMRQRKYKKKMAMPTPLWELDN